MAAVRTLARADGALASYRVSWAEVLDVREVWMAKQEGPTRLTLIAGYPFDERRPGRSLRYVVVAFLS